MAVGESSTTCPRCGAPMVERRRRADGAAFLGCARYPSCRGIRDLGPRPPEAPALPPPPVRSDDAASAGGSAAAEYERRMARHEASLPERRARAHRRAKQMLIAGVILLAVFPPLVLVMLLTAALVWNDPLYVRQTTRSWGTGAEGEAATAAILAPFADTGAVILHDRRIPGGKANIDHVFISTGGVFVIETKSYRGEVGERGGVLTVARRRTGAVAEAQREAEVVARVLAGPPATPLIVIHRASVYVREVDGVRVLRAAKLEEFLASRPPVLSPAQVADLAARIDRALPPARRAG